jgi:hypothetical protein
MLELKRDDNIKIKLKEIARRCVLILFESAYGLVEELSEHNTEPAHSIKCDKFLKQSKKYSDLLSRFNYKIRYKIVQLLPSWYKTTVQVTSGPTVTLCTTRFNLQKFYVLSTECICKFHNKDRLFAYNINWLVLITDTESVYCAVRAAFLTIIPAPGLFDEGFPWISSLLKHMLSSYLLYTLHCMHDSHAS